MSKMIELKRGVQDSINIIERNIKAYIFEEDNSVYRTVAVELRKLLLDKKASATFVEKGKKNKSLFELYYGDATDILLQSFLTQQKNIKKPNTSQVVTSSLHLDRMSILRKAKGDNNLVSLTHWLNEPLFYYEEIPQTLRGVLKHIANKEGAHIVNPNSIKKKDNITSTAIALVSEPITSSNVEFLVASNKNWNQLIIEAGMKLLNARKASDKSFLIKHSIVIPKNYLSSQATLHKGETLMEEAEQQIDAKNRAEKYKEAIKIFDEAIKLNLKNANIYHNRGAAKLHLGQHIDAIDDYNQAIELKSDEALFYSNRGITKSHLGQHADAINDCNKVY